MQNCYRLCALLLCGALSAGPTIDPSLEVSKATPNSMVSAALSAEDPQSSGTGACAAPADESFNFCALPEEIRRMIYIQFSSGASKNFFSASKKWGKEMLTEHMLRYRSDYWQPHVKRVAEHFWPRDRLFSASEKLGEEMLTAHILRYRSDYWQPHVKRAAEHCWHRDRLKTLESELRDLEQSPSEVERCGRTAIRDRALKGDRAARQIWVFEEEEIPMYKGLIKASERRDREQSPSQLERDDRPATRDRAIKGNSAASLEEKMAEKASKVASLIAEEKQLVQEEIAKVKEWLADNAEQGSEVVHSALDLSITLSPAHLTFRYAGTENHADPLGAFGNQAVSFLRLAGPIDFLADRTLPPVVFDLRNFDVNKIGAQPSRLFNDIGKLCSEGHFPAKKVEIHLPDNFFSVTEENDSLEPGSLSKLLNILGDFSDSEGKQSNLLAQVEEIELYFSQESGRLFAKSLHQLFSNAYYYWDGRLEESLARFSSEEQKQFAPLKVWLSKTTALRQTSFRSPPGNDGATEWFPSSFDLQYRKQVLGLEKFNQAARLSGHLGKRYEGRRHSWSQAVSQ